MLRDAPDVMRQFFTLAEAGDCAQLSSRMQRPEQCSDFVADMQRTKSHFQTITNTRIDGRDPDVVLVTVNVMSAKDHLRIWVLRAKWTADGWKVSL